MTDMEILCRRWQRAARAYLARFVHRPRRTEAKATARPKWERLVKKIAKRVNKIRMQERIKWRVSRNQHILAKRAEHETPAFPEWTIRDATLSKLSVLHRFNHSVIKRRSAEKRKYKSSTIYKSLADLANTRP